MPKQIPKGSIQDWPFRRTNADRSRGLDNPLACDVLIDKKQLQLGSSPINLRRPSDDHLQLHASLIATRSHPAPSSNLTMSDKGSGPTDDKAWSGQTATKFENKAYSEYFDPCQEAANKSIRCLNRNGGDREMCTDFFQAYRDCKEQWMNARKEARKNKSWFS